MVLPIPTAPDLAATIARIALGALFLVHGVPKMKDLKKTMGFVKGTGFPGGAAFALLFSLLEFFGGLALIGGFLTQPVAALFALEMVATAIFSKTKLQKKFVTGWELDVTYLLLAVTLVLLGPGPWSLDAWLGLIAPWAPPTPLTFAAILKSRSVRPPRSCVVNRTRTFVHEFSKSGWWSASSASANTRFMNATASMNVSNRHVRSIESATRAQPGTDFSLAAICASVSRSRAIRRTSAMPA